MRERIMTNNFNDEKLLIVESIETIESPDLERRRALKSLSIAAALLSAAYAVSKFLTSDSRGMVAQPSRKPQ